MVSTYTFRLRAPPGLDATLIKELKSLKVGNVASIRKVPSRKAVEIQGDQSTMWHLIARSRIAEDLQVKTSRSFSARSEKELQSNLRKVPFHCYLPVNDTHRDYKFPQTRAKVHASKLFHSNLVRNLLLTHVSELPIARAFK